MRLSKEPKNLKTQQTPEPFLKEIARAYCEVPQETLLDYCFVFPNKRSATFFSHYVAGFQRKITPTSIQPATTTISELVDNMTPGVSADRMEQILMLYRAYRNVLVARGGGMREEELAAEIDINRFVYWADVLLSDFSDVEMYLADPKEIFRNVELLKEISANYLQPEDWKAAQRYFNMDKSSQRHVKEFWNHIIHNGADGERSKAVSGFVRIWQVMFDVYNEFKVELENAGLRTSSMAYIDALDFLKTATPSDLQYKRYIFVGFTMLSKAEEKLFSLFRDMRGTDGQSMGDFYWDLASPVLRDRDNTAIGFMNKYAKEFPSLYPCVAEINRYPAIQIIGVASRAAQAQIVGQLVAAEHPLDIVEDPINADEALRETAVILPDENLMFPIVSAIPGQIKPLNITMGYRLRNSPVWGFMRAVVSLQLRGRRERDGFAFFNEDVRKVLSHPILRDSMSDLCSLAMKAVNESRLIMINSSFFDNAEFSELKPIFTPVAPGDDTFAYLRQLLEWVDSLLSRFIDSVSEASSDEVVAFDEDGTPLGAETKGDVKRLVDRILLRCYALATDQLEELIGEYLAKDVGTLLPSTIFSLIERLIAGETVNFEGRPLKGLQIMGVLEARSLDFKTVILPSMNEKIFPRTRFEPSFIPNQLRRAYGLSTIEHQEGIFAYYFYRMISRAEKVFLLYDTRPGSRGGGQMSRYLHQLQRIYRPEHIERDLIPFNIPSPDENKLFQPKTKEIMRKLNRFRTDVAPLYLSPTSINTYIDCPMKFYLSYIAGYKDDNEILDWIDEGTYGTIVHEVMQKLYDNCNERLKGAPIDGAILDVMSDDKAAIRREVTRAINRYFNFLGEDNDTPLPPSSAIIGNMIVRQISDLFRLEKTFGSFNYIGSEIPYMKHLVFREPSENGRSFGVNLTCKIDRVDRLANGLLRIVDYKTGGDEPSKGGIDDIFKSPKDGLGMRNKALLQLMIYCQAYADHQGKDEPMQPMVYLIRQLSTLGLSPVTIQNNEGGKKRLPLIDYHTILQDVNSRLIDVFEEMFDESVPFRCSEKEECRYCKFTSICGKMES